MPANASITLAGGFGVNPHLPPPVPAEFDERAVLPYARMPIEKNDAPELLAARLLPFEHEVQIRTLRAFSENVVFERKFDDDLVRPDEVPRLEEIKRISRLVYPKG